MLPAYGVDVAATVELGVAVPEAVAVACVLVAVGEGEGDFGG